nr:hypothetical protein GCM10020092_053440 [Actinoplanes digitatis]
MPGPIPGHSDEKRTGADLERPTSTGRRNTYRYDVRRNMGSDIQAIGSLFTYARTVRNIERTVGAGQPHRGGISAGFPACFAASGPANQTGDGHEACAEVLPDRP